MLTESTTSLTDKNLYAYCDNNPIMRKDSDGEFWHIVAGAAIGSAINTSLTIASNIVSGDKWSKGALTAAATGAVTGGLAASGAGLAAQVAANTTAGAVQEAVGNRKNATVRSVVTSGAVGAIAGRAGGKGAGDTVKFYARQPVKKLVNTYKHKKSAGLAFQEFKRSMKITKAHTRYLFRNRKSKYWKGIFWSNGIGSSYSGGKYIYGRNRGR